MGACLEDCSIAGNDCNNGNSVCQATGVIGAQSTDFVCIPSNQFTADNSCPTGTHEKAQNDGTYQCVAPSGVACAGRADLDLCTYTWGSNTIGGTCYMGACLEDCSIAGNDCNNGNSVCQATGVIGAQSTDFVCIPSNQYTVDGTCPSGMHEKVQNDGTYQCVAPSGVACAGRADLDSCSYTWGSNTIGGTCFSGACMASCGAAGMNNFYTAGSRETCVNTNSVCQPTGAIGDIAVTIGICIPTTSSCAARGVDTDNLCAAGYFGCDNGACAPPSVLDCMTGGFVCASSRSTNCTYGVGGECAGGAADCVVPLFQATASACFVDRDLEADNDTNEAGRCVPVPGSSVGTHVCLPDCTSLGTCAAYDAASTNDYYCQELEADGSGALRQILGATPITDVAACIPAASACDTSADCAAATSVACDTDQGICLTPSLTACSAAGVPGQAAAHTACDSDGGGDNDGRCIDSGAGLTVCLKTCIVANDCGTFEATCTNSGAGFSFCM
jgi:hypothetical protein